MQHDEIDSIDWRIKAGMPSALAAFEGDEIASLPLGDSEHSRVLVATSAGLLDLTFKEQVHAVGWLDGRLTSWPDVIARLDLRVAVQGPSAVARVYQDLMLGDEKLAEPDYADLARVHREFVAAVLGQTNPRS